MWISLATETGHVYSIGAGEQLGHPRLDTLETLDSGHLVRGLETVDAVQVSCGCHHSLVLSSQGEVFSWGKGSFGVLGFDNTFSINKAMRIPLLPSRIQHICAGDFHSLAVSGEFFPLAMNAPSIPKANSVYHHHTVHPTLHEPTSWPLHVCACRPFQLTDGGEVYGWGSNEYGQLGRVNEDDSGANRILLTPVRFATFPEPIWMAKCGSTFSVFLGGLLVCGLMAQMMCGVVGVTIHPWCVTACIIRVPGFYCEHKIVVRGHSPQPPSSYSPCGLS